MTNGFCPRCIPPGIWALCGIGFLAALWGGYELFHRKSVLPPPPTIPDVTVRFIAYDTKGNILSKTWMESTQTPVGAKPIARIEIDDKAGTEVSEPEGKTLTIQFHYGALQRLPETVTWKAGDSFRAWLQTPLRNKLKALDSHYNEARWQDIIKHLDGQISGTKCHYPVVFYVPSSQR